jgi:hypothetical protein
MYTMMGRSTLVTGRTTCSMVKESRLCLTEVLIMAPSREDVREAAEFRHGLMIRIMKARGRMERLKGTALTSGLTTGSTSVSGAKTSSMGWVSTRGLMVVNTKGSITWTRSMGMALLTGLTVANMKDFGPMANSMDKESLLFHPTARVELASGKKEDI